MTIRAYFTRIKTLLDRYAATDGVLDVVVQFDARPGEQGFLSGSVIFRDRSELFFREFLDTADNAIEKIMYSYHYQSSDAALIFRYDNAAHKPALPFRDHKHADGEIREARVPTLDEVLAEILLMKQWM